jgi:transcriptional regulator with XRE-family HTH domain
MIPMSKLLPQRIVAMREHRGLSQSDLAELAGIGQAYVSKLERGIAPNAAGIILGKLATALETSVDYLLGLTDNPAPRPSANHPALRDPAFRELADAWPDLVSEEREALAIFTRLFLKARREEADSIPTL